MNRDVLKEVLSQIQSAEKLIQKNIENNNIPQIEIDIIQSKLRSAYELMFQLNTYTTESIDKKPTLIENIKEPVVEKTEVLDISEPIENIKDSIPDSSPKTTEHTEIPTSQASTESYADKMQGKQTYINDLLAQNIKKHEVSNALQSKPIKDIELAIELNDKFLFIKDLFNGDADSYLKTIKTLNSSANFNEAFNYINQHYSWNLESEAAHKLLDFIRRRFIVAEE
jgi:hypothetical protein